MACPAILISHALHEAIRLERPLHPYSHFLGDVGRDLGRLRSPGGRGTVPEMPTHSANGIPLPSMVITVEPLAFAAPGSYTVP
jgi:hypothetical protein